MGRRVAPAILQGSLTPQLAGVSFSAGVWKLRLSEPRPVTGKAHWYDASASLARAFTGG